jgi:hypothetical protein
VRVNIVAVDAVNKLPTENLGSAYSLNIAQRIEGRPPNSESFQLPLRSGIY